MSRTGKRNVIILSLIIVAALIVLSAVAIARAAANRAALEDAQNRYEESKNPTATAKPSGLVTDGYLRLGSGEAGTMMVHYFGDDTFYGRGTGEALSESANGSILTLLHESLAATYAGGSLNGRIPPYNGEVKSTGDVIYDFAGCLSAGWNIRLSVLAPSDDTIAKNREDATLTGNASTDLEALVRMLRTTAPCCDILLVIPHNASDALAAIITEIGTDYSLLTVDLRPIGRTAGMVHESGENAGYPTAEGHRAMAEAIAERIAGAVDSGYSIPAMPQT